MNDLHDLPQPVPKTTPIKFRVHEHDRQGDDLALDAEPCPVRVTLTAGDRDFSITVVPAEHDPQTAALGRRRTAHVAVLRDLRGEPSGPERALLLYLALQRVRVWRRHVVVSAEPALSPVLSDISQLDHTMHRLHRLCDDPGRALLSARFVAEARACLSRSARVFADNGWCRDLHAGRLAREQYIAALANTHQYVRYTPRLLARAIAECPDPALRDHLTRHFRGEQHHERLIEADLRYLGADVDFVVRAMVPYGPTLAFMTLQESMVAFHRDLTCFLAAPFVAEGLAAHVGPHVLAPLAANIRRWGHPEPARALRFLTTHTREDGGDDGHWSATLAVLAGLLRDDTIQQRFLAVLHLAADTFTASYDAYADYLTLFTPPLPCHH